MQRFTWRIVAVAIVAMATLATAGNTAAEEKKAGINTSYGMKQILGSFTGQRVMLKTDSGEALEGTVTSVGDHMVHISRLSGKDYYDAVVVIDRITSVVFRAK